MSENGEGKPTISRRTFLQAAVLLGIPKGILGDFPSGSKNNQENVTFTHATGHEIGEPPLSFDSSHVEDEKLPPLTPEDVERERQKAQQQLEQHQQKASPEALQQLALPEIVFLTSTYDIMRANFEPETLNAPGLEPMTIEQFAAASETYLDSRYQEINKDRPEGERTLSFVITDSVYRTILSNLHSLGVSSVEEWFGAHDAYSNDMYAKNDLKITSRTRKIFVVPDNNLAKWEVKKTRHEKPDVDTIMHHGWREAATKFEGDQYGPAIIFSMKDDQLIGITHDAQQNKDYPYTSGWLVPKFVESMGKVVSIDTGAIHEWRWHQQMFNFDDEYGGSGFTHLDSNQGPSRILNLANSIGSVMPEGLVPLDTSVARTMATLKPLWKGWMTDVTDRGFLPNPYGGRPIERVSSVWPDQLSIRVSNSNGGACSLGEGTQMLRDVIFMRDMKENGTPPLIQNANSFNPSGDKNELVISPSMFQYEPGMVNGDSHSLNINHLAIRVGAASWVLPIPREAIASTTFKKRYESTGTVNIPTQVDLRIELAQDTDLTTLPDNHTMYIYNVPITPSMNGEGENAKIRARMKLDEGSYIIWSTEPIVVDALSSLQMNNQRFIPMSS